MIETNPNRHPTLPESKSRPGGDHVFPDRIPAWKRALDLALIIITLPVWLPVMIAVCCWVKCVSHGPVLFRQERVGFHGRHFMIYKFRSMHVNADLVRHESHFDDLVKSDRPMTKLDKAGDPRLIPGARLIRALGLDEAPQIINVILGDMSIVGPRPCTVREYLNFVPAFTDRFRAAPGLTGYWQVNGKNRTSFSRMMALDIEYARRQSFWLDVSIILRTPGAILQQALDTARGGERENAAEASAAHLETKLT